MLADADVIPIISAYNIESQINKNSAAIKGVKEKIISRRKRKWLVRVLFMYAYDCVCDKTEEWWRNLSCARLKHKMKWNVQRRKVTTHTANRIESISVKRNRFWQKNDMPCNRWYSFIKLHAAACERRCASYFVFCTSDSHRHWAGIFLSSFSQKWYKTIRLNVIVNRTKNWHTKKPQHHELNVWRSQFFCNKSVLFCVDGHLQRHSM